MNIVFTFKAKRILSIEEFERLKVYKMHEIRDYVNESLMHTSKIPHVEEVELLSVELED